MEQAITALGKDGFVGVYAANDGTAGGAIAAMKCTASTQDRPDHRTGRRAGGDPADPRRDAVHDRLQGDQGLRQRRRRSWRLPWARARRPPRTSSHGKTEAGGAQIDSIMLEPVVVTEDNVNDTIVTDGFWTAEQICTRRTRPRARTRASSREGGARPARAWPGAAPSTKGAWNMEGYC